jgi:hypothetical protein
MANEGYDPEIENKDAVGGSSNQANPGNGTSSRGDELDPVRRKERNADVRSGGSAASPKDSPTSATGNSTPESAENLQNREKNVATPGNEEHSGFSFNPNDKAQRGRTRIVLRGVGINRRTAFLGIGAATGIGGLIAVLFLILIPLKIEHIVTNLENRFMSSSENAIDQESENMLSDYVKRYVIPALSKCSGTTLDKDCNPLIGGNGNPVLNVYKGWSNARLENKLADDYGIEFKAVKNGSVTKYYMKVPGVTSPNGDDISSFVNPKDAKEFDGDLFAQVSRGETRTYVRNAFANESRWKQVLLRYKVGRLLEEKYGIKRCNAYCGQRDAFTDFVAEKKNAARILLTQRVIVPRTQTLGIVMECLFDPACDAESTQPQTPQDGTTAEAAGEPENAETDTAIRTNLEKLANGYGITDKATIQGMIDDYNDISEKGYQQFLADKVFSNIPVLSNLTENIGDKVSAVQWINQAADVIVDLKKAGPNLKKLSFLTNKEADEKTFEAFDVEADELHTGHIDPTELGSWTGMLDAGERNVGSDAQVGGTASAENTPLYQALIGGGTASNTPGNSYSCENNKPLEGLVCPEEKLGGNNALSGVTTALDTPPLSYVSSIASAWHSTVGGILSFVGNIFGGLIGDIPGVSDLSGLVSNVTQPFIKYLENDLIPNPLGDGVNVSGGREFDVMAAGAKEVGDDACEQAGCADVTATVAAQQVNQQQAEAKAQFSKESTFAQLFDTSSDYSLVTQLAMAMPSNLQSSVESSFASMISNPFGALTHGFASVFSGHSSADASYTTAEIADPFDSGSKAWPAQDIPAHPIDDWDQDDCNDTSSNGPVAKWQQAAADAPPNSETGMPTYSTPEPCLLIEDADASIGGYFDSSNLSSDDLADVPGSSAEAGDSSSSSPTTTASSAGTTVSAQQLAQQVLQNSKINLGYTTSVKEDIEDAAAGKPGTAGAMTSAAILQLIATIGQTHDVAITAIQSDGQGHCDGEPKSACPNDPHYKGDAVDFGSLDGTMITGRNPPAITIMQQAFTLLPSGSGFGQDECGSQYSTTAELPNKDITFSDTCNHLHVQVPAGTP